MGAEQKHLEPLKIDPSMTDEKADALGMLAMSYTMTQRMRECREKGKAGWHRIGTTDPATGKANLPERFAADAITAINEKRWVDAANYMMMLFNLENMDNDCHT